MPVVTAVESRGQFPRRSHIGVAVEHVADLIRVFLSHAGQRQLGEPFRRDGIKLRSNVFSNDVDYWKQQNSTDKTLHLGSNVAASLKFSAPADSSAWRMELSSIER